VISQFGTDRDDRGPVRVETVVIGAGQAGLATGYHPARRGREFVILDAYQRVGDNWR
jgi:putative flavoprotein involved in K+ transport